VDGVQVDAEELGAALQGAAMGRVRVGSWASQAGMPGSLDEHMFEQQWDEAGEQAAALALHPLQVSDIHGHANHAGDLAPRSASER
jgi:hypothetical protein